MGWSKKRVRRKERRIVKLFVSMVWWVRAADLCTKSVCFGSHWRKIVQYMWRNRVKNITDRENRIRNVKKNKQWRVCKTLVTWSNPRCNYATFTTWEYFCTNSDQYPDMAIKSGPNPCDCLNYKRQNNEEKPFRVRHRFEFQSCISIEFDAQFRRQCDRLSTQKIKTHYHVKFLRSRTRLVHRPHTFFCQKNRWNKLAHTHAYKISCERTEKQ